MDELNEFFNFNGELGKRIQLEGPETGGFVPRSDEELLEESEEHHRNPCERLDPDFDYVSYYKQKAKEEDERRERSMEESGHLESLDEVTSMGDRISTMDLVDNDLFYNKNAFRCASKTELPIDRQKSLILDTIGGTVVSVIEGPTGCGKTTRVPQWILEEHMNSRKFCNIVVTQPRRIAAMSIAKRVCDENRMELGSLVGYQVALDSHVSDETRLTYVTTGVLLQKLVTSRNMKKYTHIILDEVHERNQDMDFLFVVVKKLMKNQIGVKVILMSATFNTERFTSYFRDDDEGNAPAIVVPNTAKFHYTTYYLEGLSTLGKVPEITYNDPKISKEMYSFTLKTINAFEEIDMIEESANARPSILIFLPGIYEIEQLYNILNSQKCREEMDPMKAKLQWWLIPLHSTITLEEQVRVFKQPPPNHRKIILATNIAESSITVPDIKYVIDFCLSKVLTSNRETNFSSLQLSWASKANCTQRAGRAGRVRDGRVYRMVSEDFYSNLPDECVPEIQRCPLDNVVLSAKLLDMGSPLSILSFAMDPPYLPDVGRSILNLKQLGALLKTVDGVLSIEDGDITFIGRIMAKLPVDIRISKLIVLGYVFGCVEECIIIGGAMSVRNVFSTPFQERMTAYSTKLTWADGSSSDCIALLGVYKTYQHMSRQKYFATNRHGERGWSKRLYLQANALHEMESLIKDLKVRMSREEVLDAGSINLWNDYELPLILKLLIAGAFYPYYFIFSHGGDSEEREASKILGGRNPRNTIYFTNMDQQQPTQLYASSIRQALKDCSREDCIVSSDGSGSKIYVTFPSQESLVQGSFNEKCSFIPGKVALPVYKAIKMRQLKMPVTLHLLPRDKAQTAADNLGITPFSTFSNPNENAISTLNPKLPDIDENYVEVCLTHIIDCGHFWSQYADEHSHRRLRWIEGKMCQPGTLAPLEALPKFGVMYAAPYQESPNHSMLFYRAKVTNFLDDGKVTILYIDYGNGAIIKGNSLQMITGEHAEPILSFQALAFECILTEVAPSLMLDSRGLWTNAAIKTFSTLVTGKKLLGKVYSVAHSVVSLELMEGNQSINKYLIDQGFAIAADESYASKENRALRDSADTYQQSQKIALNKQQAKKLESANTLSNFYPPINLKDCVRSINLKGPFSPLETKLQNLMYAGKNKSVAVQWDSVNSVILNSDPQYPCERLLVAAHIDQSSSGDHIMLRNTTILPNIPGLPALVSLIFCPNAVLHPDLSLTKYSAALCGLGHVDEKPLFPEHDIVVPIDVDLTNDDLKYINKLRCLMDSMLLTEGTQSLPACGEKAKADNRVQIKNTLEKIIFAKRKYREAGCAKKPWSWVQKYPDMEVECINPFGERAIYPPHDGLTLNETSYDTLMKLAETNRQLYEMCDSYLLSGNRKVDCPLCVTDKLSVTDMKIHLSSRLHKEREKDLPHFE